MYAGRGLNRGKEQNEFTRVNAYVLFVVGPSIGSALPLLGERLAADPLRFTLQLFFASNWWPRPTRLRMFFGPLLVTLSRLKPENS